MGSLVDAVFGGSATKAAKADIKATEKAMLEYQKGVKEAKQEIGKYSGEATDTRRFRTDQAMQAMQQGFAPALDTMSQGNMSAQQMLAGAAPQMQNAILGNAVDYGALQPQGINFDAQAFLGGMPSIYDQNPNMAQPQQTASNGVGMGQGGGNQGMGGDSWSNPFNPYTGGNIFSGGGAGVSNNTMYEMNLGGSGNAFSGGVPNERQNMYNDDFNNAFKMR